MTPIPIPAHDRRDVPRRHGANHHLGEPQLWPAPKAHARGVGAGTSAWYNEIEPVAAQTLRNLIHAGHIAPGVVDERSIEDVRPDELAGFTQCHFFAGVGIWSYALRQAGWTDDRPVWTGSCPCQPFSAAGKGDGFADERHLWPAWYHLVAQCRPANILGEQVASKATEPWIDLVHADLEALGYAFGSVPFPAAGVGAPHIRDRNYWFAGVTLGDTGSAGLEGWRERLAAAIGRHGAARPTAAAGFAGGLADSHGRQRDGLAVIGGHEQHWDDPGRAEERGKPEPRGELRQRPGPTNGFWRAADWLHCRDEFWRPVEPGTFPLAHGAASRVGRLRAYGNGLCAETAIAFIRAAMT